MPTYPRINHQTQEQLDMAVEKHSDGSYSDVVDLAPGAYLGGQTLTPNGNSVAATIPAGTTVVMFDAEGGDGYYRINGTPADADSPGFIPQNAVRIILDISNLSSLSVYTAAGATKIHIQYFKG